MVRAQGWECYDLSEEAGEWEMEGKSGFCVLGLKSSWIQNKPGNVRGASRK